MWRYLYFVAKRFFYHAGKQWINEVEVAGISIWIHHPETIERSDDDRGGQLIRPQVGDLEATTREYGCEAPVQ